MEHPGDQHTAGGLVLRELLSSQKVMGSNLSTTSGWGTLGLNAEDSSIFLWDQNGTEKVKITQNWTEKIAAEAKPEDVTDHDYRSSKWVTD